MKDLLPALLLCAALGAPSFAAQGGAPFAPPPEAEAFAKRFKEAVDRRDVKALQEMFHEEGGGKGGLKFNARFFADVKTKKFGAATVREVLPPAEQKWVKFGCTHRPNLQPLHMLNIDFAEKGTGGYLLWLAKKDGAFVIATTLAEHCMDAEPAEDGSAAVVPAGVARLLETCANEVSLFCAGSAKQAKALLACLRGLEGGVSKPCRKAIRKDE